MRAAVAVFDLLLESSHLLGGSVLADRLFGASWQDSLSSGSTQSTEHTLDM